MSHPKCLKAMLQILDMPDHPQHKAMIAEVRQHRTDVSDDEIIAAWRSSLRRKLAS